MKLDVKIFSDLLFRKFFLTVIILANIHFTTLAQDYLSKITYALKQGNVEPMAIYFDQSVDLTFSDKTKTYAKKQALVIVQNFFNKIEPKDYVNAQRGVSNSTNTRFHIGSLYTSNGVYKVYMFFILKKGQFYLKELRFEK